MLNCQRNIGSRLSAAIAAPEHTYLQKVLIPAPPICPALPRGAWKGPHLSPPWWGRTKSLIDHTITTFHTKNNTYILAILGLIHRTAFFITTDCLPPADAKTSRRSGARVHSGALGCARDALGGRLATFGFRMSLSYHHVPLSEMKLTDHYHISFFFFRKRKYTIFVPWELDLPFQEPQ